LPLPTRVALARLADDRLARLRHALDRDDVAAAARTRERLDHHAVVATMIDRRREIRRSMPKMLRIGFCSSSSSAFHTTCSAGSPYSFA
jgi:hypothetical protein